MCVVGRGLDPHLPRRDLVCQLQEFAFSAQVGVGGRKEDSCGLIISKILTP